MKLRKEVAVLLSVLFFVALIMTPAAVFAGETTIDLVPTTDVSTANFGSVVTKAWAGDVMFQNQKIGEFNAQVTHDTSTGAVGNVVNYDLVCQSGGGPLGGYISMRVNQIASGGGSGVGMVYSASIPFQDLFGASVVLQGTAATITW